MRCQSQCEFFWHDGHNAIHMMRNRVINIALFFYFSHFNDRWNHRACDYCTVSFLMRFQISYTPFGKLVEVCFFSISWPALRVCFSIPSSIVFLLSFCTLCSPLHPCSHCFYFCLILTLVNCILPIEFLIWSNVWHHLLCPISLQCCHCFIFNPFLPVEWMLTTKISHPFPLLFQTVSLCVFLLFSFISLLLLIHYPHSFSFTSFPSFSPSSSLIKSLPFYSIYHWIFHLIPSLHSNASRLTSINRNPFCHVPSVPFLSCPSPPAGR